MAIKADFHLHSRYSGDGKASMEELIQKGISLGLDCLCFTEHQDIDAVYENPADAGMFDLNTDSYLYEFATLKQKYTGQIKLLFGVELGLQPHLRRELALYSKAFPFDFILASSHFCNRKDPYYPSFFEGRSDEEAYREYFSSILDNLKVFDNFDVYGHLDYVVRYGKTRDDGYCYAKYQDILDKILDTLLEKEKGLELNTGAFRHSLKEPNPSREILKRYREKGGEIITVGSDAHETCYLADRFDDAAEILTECGFRYYTTFENRLPEFHRI